MFYNICSSGDLIIIIFTSFSCNLNKISCSYLQQVQPESNVYFCYYPPEDYYYHYSIISCRNRSCLSQKQIGLLYDDGAQGDINNN
jgi:hypothetical protein